MSKQLYERGLVTEDESTQFRVSIGPIGNAVAEAVDAEAFLFVRYSGFKKSEGLIAKEVVANALLGALTGVVVVPAATGASMEMALVDSTSGDVLWSNRGLGNAAALLDKLPEYGVATGTKSETSTTAAEDQASVAAATPDAYDSACPTTGELVSPRPAGADRLAGSDKIMAVNQGVAGAIVTGIRNADHEIVCSMDCDCSYDPSELEKMIPLIAGADLVTRLMMPMRMPAKLLKLYSAL